jgi:hypothetical protein
MPLEPLRMMNSLGRSRSLSLDKKPLKVCAGRQQLTSSLFPNTPEGAAVLILLGLVGKCGQKTCIICLSLYPRLGRLPSQIT